MPFIGWDSISPRAISVTARSVHTATLPRDRVPGQFRQALTPPAQSGFDTSAALHTSQVVTERGESRARPVKRGTGPLAPKGTQREILSADLWKPPFIGNVQVTPGWKLVISFSSSQKTTPLVEVGPGAPVRGRDGALTFPVGSGAVSQFVSSNTGLYYAEFDVLREGFEVNKSYSYIVNVSTTIRRVCARATRRRADSPWPAPGTPAMCAPGTWDASSSHMCWV